MLRDLLPHRERIMQYSDILVPDIHWNGKRRRVDVIEPETAEA
jgi:hypothetical protein